MSHPRAKDDEALSEVNVIPLADLSLVLLIILMLMSPMISQALIQISSARAAAAQMQEELQTPETPVIVSFEPGALKLNGVPMGSDMEFVKRLEDVMARRRDKSVVITASPLLSHGKVVRLMDVVRHHGGEELVMVKWDPNSLASQLREQASGGAL
jgi:biopolymer transport protein ExbD